MTTHAREIANDDWRLFFDDTSRHYQGRDVRIELLGPDLAVHVIAQRLPLMGITIEQRLGGTAEIQIIAGDLDKGHVTHVISMPQHVWIDQEINGGDNAIEILSTDGNALIIELSAEQHGGVANRHI